MIKEEEEEEGEEEEEEEGAHWAISCSNQCSTTMVCFILSVGWCI